MIDSLKKTRTIFGKVSGISMNKTITVEFDRKVRAPLYGKLIKKSTKLIVHDESNKCKIGDEVEIRETKPYSKLKSWCLVKVLN